MAQLLVKILYTSVDVPGFNEDYSFSLEKCFNFPRMPVCNCRIMIHNDAIQYIKFKDPIYDPDIDLYIVTMATHENVERYHVNTRENMDKVMKRYKKHGWTCIRQNG